MKGACPEEIEPQAKTPFQIAGRTSQTEIELFGLGPVGYQNLAPRLGDGRRVLHNGWLNSFLVIINYFPYLG